MEFATKAALETCDSEPIHIPGAIQGFGCLIAFEKGMGDIAAISANSEDYIGQSPLALLGRPLSKFFEASMLHSIGNKLAYSTIGRRREHVGSLDVARKRVTADGGGKPVWDIFVHAGEKFDFIEVVATSVPDRSIQDRVAALARGMQGLSSLDEVFELATASVKAVSNYDRVMFYRFLPDGTGEVVAEERSGHMEPFLGLRYPASDIPKQARALYASTPIRAISDVKERQVPLLLGPEYFESDFDLSIAVLRATSPVHCEYLANMGVASTMTIPVVVQGELWGLITCHNEEPRIPEIHILDAGEVIGHIVSFTVSQLLQLKSLELAAKTASVRDSYISLQTKLETPSEFAGKLWSEVRGQLSICGVGVQIGDDWATAGKAPSTFEHAASPMDFQAGSTLGELVFSSEAEGILCDDTDQPLPGFLLVPLTTSPESHIVFFRRAVQSEVSWAGAPDKEIIESEDGLRLSPRKSFAKYIEANGNKSDDWSNDDIQFAIALQRECASSQSAAGTILEQKDSLRLLAAELNHRVKNILALVRSLSSNARDKSETFEDYAESLERRLVSLAASHDLLTQAAMTGVAFRDVVAMELAPYLSPSQQEAAVSGPDLTLLPDAVPMATLLVHELASNAAKHGALSQERGNVAVSWTITGEDLAFNWQESGGPTVSTPSRKGFGMELLREAIPFEFGGTAELDFQPTGLIAYYKIPASRILTEPGSTTPQQVVGIAETSESPPPLDRSKGLVVEDSYLLATEHSNIMKLAGFTSVDRASNVRSAIELIEKCDYGFALLDINLRQEMSFEIASRLREKGVPFAFVTGYGNLTTIPEEHAMVPILKKPLELSELIQIVEKV